MRPHSSLKSSSRLATCKSDLYRAYPVLQVLVSPSCFFKSSVAAPWLPFCHLCACRDFSNCWLAKRPGLPATTRMQWHTCPRPLTRSWTRWRASRTAWQHPTAAAPPKSARNCSGARSRGLLMTLNTSIMCTCCSGRTSSSSDRLSDQLGLLTGQQQQYIMGWHSPLPTH